jgi:hypothetical protein
MVLMIRLATMTIVKLAFRAAVHIPTKEATLSGAKKPLVPIQKGQPFRSNEASRYGYWLLSGGAPALQR